MRKNINQCNRKSHKPNKMYSKAYFHMMGSEDYYQVKYDNYEKAKKIRSKHKLYKENFPVLY